jgi:hypothetical protein
MPSRRLLTLAFAAVTAATLSHSVLAETQWQREHPRREQVNARLANQDKRIHQERREGELTRSQAAALHKEDRQIRHEEQQMASMNHGHITPAEQRALNQQENAVSRQIGK